MASQGDARAAAAEKTAALRLAALPHALLLEVLSRVPVDSRLRCREVLRAWRTALNERSLWLRLDLSPASGVARTAATEGLLRAAAERAGGQLETLDVSGCDKITSDALLEVVRANRVTLRELHMRGDALARSVAVLATLLRAAPHLHACHAVAYTFKRAEARAMLRNEPPFGALRLERLSVRGEEFAAEDAILALAADLAACTFIRELLVSGAPLDTATALDALVDAALARRLRTLRLLNCDVTDHAAPALARLLGGGALAELEIHSEVVAFLVAPAASVLFDALRACSTLTALTLRDVLFWLDLDAAAKLLGALTGHASLQTLVLSQNWNWINEADQAVAGAALGALVAANAPALTELDVSRCDLQDAGLGPLFDALPANTHLRKLDCGRNWPSYAFVRERLLPAVRANTSLVEVRL
jgi:hypothetical protein